MKVLYANPNIAPHVKETLASYYENKCLDKFYTSYYFNSNTTINRFIVRQLTSIANELKRRSIEVTPPSFIRSRPLPELVRVFCNRKLNTAITDLVWEWSELGFDKWVSKNLTKDLDWVHVSEHAGLATLKKAKQMGIFSVYEQPSQHHSFFTDIVKRQLQSYPEFKNDDRFDILIDDHAIRRNQRRDEELRTADLVLCNSTFTKNTLITAGIPIEKILTIPLGFPNVAKKNSKVSDGKTIFMYAGNLSLRKGCHILLQAWKALSPKNAKLWLIGRKDLPQIFFEGLPASVTFFANIPHQELMNRYQQADVFILPTLADGFGMVITEAMSRGLPVITTWNSGGADVIDEKKNGLVISPESKDAIMEAIQWCLNSKTDLSSMGHSAQAKAAEYPWSAYRNQLISAIITKKKEWDDQ